MRSRRRKSVIETSISNFESKFVVSGDKLYAHLLNLICKDLPTEFNEFQRVFGHLRNGDPLPLVMWADSLAVQQYPSAALHYAASQISALVLKYPFKGLDAQAERLATEKFRKAEHRCMRYNQIHRARRSRCVPALTAQYESMRRWIRYVLGDKPPLCEIYREAGFGPGASIGVGGDATSIAHKYFAPRWTSTPMALPYTLNALKTDPLCRELLCGNWRDVDWANIDRLSADGYMFSGFSGRYVVTDWDDDLFELQFLSKVDEVVHNKITFVPKTALVHRTIAVEPLLNGYMQKGIDAALRKRLLRVGVDLTDQSRNQELARLGSIEKEDPYCTIDLSSASDSICIELIRDLLPYDWWRLMDDTRSPCYELHGVIRRYHKFVSMGNGFCFPLESLLFAAACQVFTRDFSVYGDDIIVRQTHAPGVLRLLYSMGFRHNPRKTFISGPFRESCGADWWEGENVRPLTLDYALDSTRAIVKFCNLVSGNQKWFSFLELGWKHLAHNVLQGFPLVRPYQGKRIDGALTVPLDEFHARTDYGRSNDLQCPIWYERCYEPVQDGALRRAERYPTVLMMAALRGNSSVLPFPYRRKTRTKLRREASAGPTSTWEPPGKRYA